MIDAMAYNITVRKGHFEGEVCFEARVSELPDIAEYADTFEEAYELALDSIETTAEIFMEKGMEMPVPMVPAADFSGRVTLRLPKSLHRSLALVADQEGVSLNQHLVNVLSYFSGFGQALNATTAMKSLWQTTSAVHKPAQNANSLPRLKVVRSSTPQNEASYG